MDNGNGLNYRMRAFRLALGLSQEEVGELVGVSNVTISLYERGLIDSEFAQPISDALYSVKEKLTARYGYWYDNYIELNTAMTEIQVWIELEGRAPTEVIRRAKDMAVAFSNI